MADARPLKLAYFTNAYPAVSHTFIRREIEAVEALGTPVIRYALKSREQDLVDPKDKAEFRRTRFIQHAGAASFLSAVLRAVTRSPSAFFATLWLALMMGRRSDTGLLRHIFYFAEAAVLAEWCRHDGVTHLHVHFGTNPAAIALFAHRLGGAPYSLTIHGFEEFYRAAFLSLDAKISGAKFVACVSAYGRGQLMRVTAPSLWWKFKLVRCGLDETFLAAPPPPCAAPRLVCVGRLCAEKAQLLLVEAMRELKLRGIACELVLIGDGELRNEIEAAVARAGLGDRITMLGSAPGETVRAEVARSRALVLPSFIENLPVSLMEAMALGRPVISTFAGGIPELVTPGETGWLVPSGDAAALAEALAKALAADAASLQRMGEDARRAVAARHDASQEAKILRELIMEPAKT